MYLMDNSQREKETIKANRDKLIKDLFKVAFLFLALKGAKIVTEKYLWNGQNAKSVEI